MTERMFYIGSLGPFFYDDAEDLDPVEQPGIKQKAFYSPDGYIDNVASSEHAATADYATTAGSATNATNAVNATNATNADSADDADKLGGELPSYYAVASSKMKFTAEGGLAVQLTNRTGANSVLGSLVTVSDTYDNAVKLCTADIPTCVGVVYENSVADGSEVWVVVSGRCQVLLEDGTASTRGYWVKVSDNDNGRADASNASPPGGTIAALEDHNSEIGHCLESKSSGTDVLAYCIVHFN